MQTSISEMILSYWGPLTGVSIGHYQELQYSQSISWQAGLSWKHPKVQEESLIWKKLQRLLSNWHAET